MDEDVVRVVGVARHQVGGIRPERDEAPVRRDAGLALPPLPWAPPELTLTRSGRARLAVVDKDVVRAVGVARHQVGGDRAEDDEAPVR